MKVSIITISYNSEKTIEKTFKSVLSQSHRPLEYVLVDGGSKDRTINLIEKYIPLFKKKDIVVNFKSEKDKGISDAFNKGIERSTGDLIGIINSDDQLTDDVLVKISKNINKDTDVVCGDCLWIDEKNKLEYIRKSNMQLDQLKYKMVLMHPTCFVKKSAYMKWGNFDTSLKYVMDKDLMARFYKKGVKFQYLPMTIAVMSAGGVSDENSKLVFKEGIIVAMRNGVPKRKAYANYIYKLFYTKIIFLFKKNKLYKNYIYTRKNMSK